MTTHQRNTGGRPAVISRRACKQLDRMTRDYGAEQTQPVWQMIESLAGGTLPAGACRLAWPGYRRAWRVADGVWRVIFTTPGHGEPVEIIAAGHRRDMYRRPGG